MIEKDTVYQLVRDFVENEEMFIVDVSVKPGNKILVLIDSMEGVNIRKCVELSRLIEGQFDREVEDFELQVSSPGLDQPFTVIEQYEKNIGKEVAIYTNDGISKKGILISVGREEIKIEEKKKIKEAGISKKVEVTEQVIIKLNNIKTAKIVISFK